MTQATQTPSNNDEQHPINKDKCREIAALIKEAGGQCDGCNMTYLFNIALMVLKNLPIKEGLDHEREKDIWLQFHIEELMQVYIGRTGGIPDPDPAVVIIMGAKGDKPKTN